MDVECETGEITYKQVQSEIHYTKVIYASDVLFSFLSNERQCWQLYHKLLHNLGMEYAYNALYKACKNYLADKDAYLQNKDVKNWRIKQVEAPMICYAYVLFANSTSYQQLPVIMYSIYNRAEKNLARMADVSCKQEVK